MQVVREGGATCVTCRACIVVCESVGKTTVEAIVGLPCGLYLIDETSDAEWRRDRRDDCEGSRS